MCKILIGKFLSIMSSFILRNVYCRFQQILACSSFEVCYLSSEEELEFPLITPCCSYSKYTKILIKIHGNPNKNRSPEDIFTAIKNYTI